VSPGLASGNRRRLPDGCPATCRRRPPNIDRRGYHTWRGARSARMPPNRRAPRAIPPPRPHLVHRVDAGPVPFVRPARAAVAGGKVEEMRRWRARWRPPNAHARHVPAPRPLPPLRRTVRTPRTTLFCQKGMLGRRAGRTGPFGCASGAAGRGRRRPARPTARHPRWPALRLPLLRRRPPTRGRGGRRSRRGSARRASRPPRARRPTAAWARARGRPTPARRAATGRAGPTRRPRGGAGPRGRRRA